MARRRTRFSTFSLSFLDIMSCGFGAVALIFLIIKHETDTRVEVEHQDLLAEVSLLEEDIRYGEAQLVRARNTIAELDQELVQADGLARRINDNIRALENRIAQLDAEADDQQIEDLEKQLAAARQRRQELEQERIERGNDVRRFVGEGQRQYLTGLKLGGSRILILVDASSSMLDDTLVNVIRRRNMSDDIKRSSPKWLRTVETVQWLAAQLPPQASFQLYAFNTDIKAMRDGSEGKWLGIGESGALDEAVQALQEVVPNGGTNLDTAFSSISQLSPLPDNIYLITDGLPTQGRKAPRRGTVSGEEREDLFEEAVERIPYGIPVNVILLPMEGDPMAAAGYWRLAQVSGGSFISPAEDWP